MVINLHIHDVYIRMYCKSGDFRVNTRVKGERGGAAYEATMFIGPCGE